MALMVRNWEEWQTYRSDGDATVDQAASMCAARPRLGGAHRRPARSACMHVDVRRRSRRRTAGRRCFDPETVLFGMPTRLKFL